MGRVFWAFLEEEKSFATERTDNKEGERSRLYRERAKEEEGRV